MLKIFLPNAASQSPTKPFDVGRAVKNLEHLKKLWRSELMISAHSIF
jgi:hypothetical protein